MQIFTLADVYPVGSTVFVLAQPFYGCRAEILDHLSDKIRVKVDMTLEPDLSRAYEVNVSGLDLVSLGRLKSSLNPEFRPRLVRDITLLVFVLFILYQPYIIFAHTAYPTRT